jgi:hypothetical protein
MAYTNIDDPSTFFQTALYTGNGSSISITNDGNSNLQPDWVWIKNRTQYQHQVYDTNRGVHKKLMTSATNEESTDTTALTAFTTDGFSTGANVGVNQNSTAHVAWQWKCNGGTTASNTSGSITSTVQANTDAGFSIVTYTGTGATATVGHGLGVAPQIIIGKRRSGSSNWWFGGSILTSTQTMYLNLTNGIDTVAESIINNVTTSTTFKLGTDTNRNAFNATNVAYCFAEKQGYSKFGTYIGNGNANGPFVYTGFKPAFSMIKAATTAGQNWLVQDNKRPGYNPTSGRLFANTTGAESTDTELPDHLSNGFKVRSTSYGNNKSGETYIYMAFAENPFVTSTGVPATAR